jgi:hypothetical protein
MISFRLFAFTSTLILAACGGSSDPTFPDNNSTPSDPIVTVDDSGNTQVNSTALSDQLANMSVGQLNDQEEAGLLLMREEEKLARDVYNALYAIHGTNIFTNIASSEQTHTDAIKTLLDRYMLTDPVATDVAGVFQNTDLQMIYDQLVAAGTPSLLDALRVGATVEELDIFDIARLRGELVDNADIDLVYDNLMKGSRNHLRSFYRQIQNQNADYEPIYITQEAFDAIVTSDMERG